MIPVQLDHLPKRLGRLWELPHCPTGEPHVPAESRGLVQIGLRPRELLQRAGMMCGRRLHDPIVMPSNRMVLGGQGPPQHLLRTIAMPQQPQNRGQPTAHLSGPVAGLQRLLTVFPEPREAPRR